MLKFPSGMNSAEIREIELRGYFEQFMIKKIDPLTHRDSIVRLQDLPNIFPRIPPRIPSCNVQWEKQKVAKMMKQQLVIFEQSYIRPKPSIVPLTN